MRIAAKRRGERTSRDHYIDELNQVQYDIDVTRRRFNMATEKELIDQCVFELNALQSRYTYFLRLIKEVEHAEIG